MFFHKVLFLEKGTVEEEYRREEPTKSFHLVIVFQTVEKKEKIVYFRI